MKQQTWFFLRGLIREAGHWAGFLEEFARAFPERRMVALDLPGAGRYCDEACPTSVPAMVQRMRIDFLRERGEENYLFAVSLGAMAALQWAQDFPQDFRALTLVNSSVRGLSPLHHRLRPGALPSVLGIFFASTHLAREQRILALSSNRPERHALVAVDWARVAEVRPISRANALRQLWAAAKFRRPELKPGTRMLVLSGAGDRLVHPECSQAIARHWGAEMRVHPTAGHDLTMDEPAWALEQVKNFSA